MRTRVTIITTLLPAVLSAMWLGGCDEPELDYDPNDPPPDAVRVAKEIRETQCGPHVTLETTVAQLRLSGVRSYVPTECWSCYYFCEACDCPYERLFAVKVDPPDLGRAAEQGWRSAGADFIVSECSGGNVREYRCLATP